MASAMLWVLPVVGAAAGDPSPKPAPLPPGPAKHGNLDPGKSAGVRNAQLPRTGLALVGGGAIIAVIAVVASSSSGNGGAQPQAQSMPATTS